MKELWSRSLELFRRHPILWVPCIVAACLMLAMRRLRRTVISGIFHWFAIQHSVLGGEALTTDLEKVQHRTMMVMVPIGICQHFLEVCFFTVAFAMTAKLSGMVLEEQKPDTISALKAIRSRWGEILLFSLKYMVLLGVIGAVMMLSTSVAMISYRLLEIAASKAFVYPVTLALEAGAGWLLIPPAIRLVQTPGAPPISTETRTLGTILMVLTSAAALALENLVNRVEAGAMLENQLEITAVAVMNTIVVNAPEVFLFIGLSLLARQGMGEAEVPAGAEAETLPPQQLAD